MAVGTRYSFLSLLVVAAVLWTQTAGAQQIAPSALGEIQTLQAEKASRSPAQRKISSRLLYTDRMIRGQDVAPGIQTLATSIAVDAQGVTRVDIQAAVTPKLLAEVRRLGGEVLTSFPAYDAIQVRMPLARLEELAEHPAVRAIRPPAFWITHKINTSQGDITHGTEPARTTLGVDGSGVTIGVLSDGVDQLAALQASGDLPPACPASPCVEVLAGQAGSGSEGTAMLEIIFDLAPGADLKFATAGASQASFAQNILALATAGCDVIVDDISFLAERVFQDGIVAQAVNDVYDDGVIYLTAAGNEGNLNDGTSGVWEGDFVATAGPPVLGGTVHDFGGVNNNTITKDPPFAITLQWSDAWGASGNDYDLYMLNPGLTSIVAASTDIQNGTQNPLEAISSSSSNHTNRRLVVQLDSGVTRYLHLNTIRGELAIATAGQTWGHSAAAKAVGIAAVDVDTTG